MRKNILWISPNFNFYKSRFLNKLSKHDDFNISILAGKDNVNQGFINDQKSANLVIENIDVYKKDFHKNKRIYLKLWNMLSNGNFNIVNMPVEKKHINLIVYCYILKHIFKFDLVSYCHPIAYSKIKNRYRFDRLISKLMFIFYDKAIFYTKRSREIVIEKNLINKKKTYFANNTLDTDLIWDNYSFKINNSEEKTILFIGRLIPSKRLDLLFKYYYKLKTRIPFLKLLIIGDGPERNQVKNEVDCCKHIKWYGAVVDEKKIGIFMNKSHIVFIPGASGLSIVHAFCYGKPYITLGDCKIHGPELSYLKNNNNGYLLSSGINKDVHKLTELLMDKNKYENFCNNAYKTAQGLSIQKWCEQMKSALLK